MSALGHRFRGHGISVSTFYDALNVHWLRCNGRTAIRPRLALAISGGVDSMALAKLCSMLQEYPFTRQMYDFQFKAFIVDHKAREGSTEEANVVKHNLIHMGLNAKILDLQWPTQARPLELPDFETQARRLRYQALALGCHAENITHLLLAHHADDQAETVLMRLASGQKGVGLRGMQNYGKVPECQGMHGIWESGYYEQKMAFRNKIPARSRGTFSRFDQLSTRIIASTPIFENGGIKIMRPLLRFFKEDLIETCNKHGVPWIEDETNQDTWRTPRNSIRSFLKKRQLPAALRRASLIALSLKVGARERAHLHSALELLKQCKIILLDVRSGSAVIRLPSQINERAISAGRFGERSVSKALIASLLLRILSQPISPCEEIALHTLQFAARVFFSELDYQATGPARQHNPKRFTAAGVQFERINVPLNTITLGPGLDPEPNSPHRQPPHDLDEDHLWVLTRQPFQVNRAVAKQEQRSEAPSYLLTIKSPYPSEDANSEPPPWSSWHLWDGRYWIRLMNLSKSSLKVRPFREADLHALRTSLSRLQVKLLEDVLAAAAPGKVRWTLPVIAQLGQASSPGAEKIIALPSLGKAGVIDVEEENGQRMIDWEIRYKRVKLGKPGLLGMEVHRDIVTSWEDS